MLENGAEIYRVEEHTNYILKVSGLKTTTGVCYFDWIYDFS